MSLRASLVVISILAAPSVASALQCPSGFLEVMSQGVRLGCIQEAEEVETPTVNWYDAILTCQTAHGGTLPSVDEWWQARNTVTLIDNGPGAYEWTRDVVQIGSADSVAVIRPMAGVPSTSPPDLFSNIAGGPGPQVRCWIPGQGLFLTTLPAPMLTLLGGGLLGGALIAAAVYVLRKRTHVGREAMELGAFSR